MLVSTLAGSFEFRHDLFFSQYRSRAPRLRPSDRDALLMIEMRARVTRVVAGRRHFAGFRRRGSLIARLIDGRIPGLLGARFGFQFAFIFRAMPPLRRRRNAR